MAIGLEKWALVAEIVSGVAVLVTLVVLVVGVNDNTNVTRAAVYEDLMADLNQFNLAMVNDQALAALWLGDDDFADLDEAKASRLVLLNRVIFRIYEAAFFSYQNGSLADAQWSRFRETICNTKDRRDQDLWLATSTILTAEFQSYIADTCNN